MDQGKTFSIAVCALKGRCGVRLSSVTKEGDAAVLKPLREKKLAGPSTDHRAYNQSLSMHGRLLSI
jgi:hypothetical protein